MTEEQDEGISLSRRDVFVGALGAAASCKSEAGVAALNENSQIDSVSSDSTSDPDVVIIGAGFSGITAARELRRYGYKVVILEARNRLGGRTFTNEFEGKSVDFGGTWVHWLQPYIWAEIGRYGVELEETHGATATDVILLDYDGKRHELNFLSIFEEFNAAAEKFFDNKAYLTLPRPAEPFVDTDWMEEDRVAAKEKIQSSSDNPIIQALVETLYGLYGASELSNVSWIHLMRWYALSGYNITNMNDITARFKIKGGTRNLLDRMAEDTNADIRIGTAVSSVEQDSNNVTITTESGDKLTCKAAICTVPLNVLQDVKFSPTLNTQKLAAAKEGHAGTATKVHIRLDKEYSNFSAWSPGGDTPLNFVLWEGVEDGKTSLIAFGPSPETLNVNDIEAVEAAMKKFIPDAKVSACYGYDWNLDPYSKGVWCVYRPGQSRFLEQLQKPEGRVHFSSADWASGWVGSIDGAIEQGIVNASALHEQLTNA